MGLYVTCVCPSCFEEIYLGECAIVSGITGQDMKPRSKGQVARMRVEPLGSRKYVLELARRKCTNFQCGYLLPHNIESVPSLTLVVVGDTFSGKSHYIAALIHQIKSEWLGSGGFARFTCLTPDIEKTYMTEYFEPLFLHKRTIAPTRAATAATKIKPLIYELVVSSSPRHPPTTLNLMIYDASGEDYETMERLVNFARFVLNTSAFIFVADPLMMPPIFNALPPHLQTNLRSQYSLGVGRRAADRLNAVISLFERYRGHPSGARLHDTPIAIMVSKADLFDQLPLPRYQFMTHPQYRMGVVHNDVETVDWEVKELLRQYQQQDLLTATSRFSRARFFATSATGEPPDASGQFANVKPRRCLDPLLWIMDELAII